MNDIKIQNYSKKFRKFLSIDNISFNVKQGSIHAFIGPNGAGKTTTIKAIIGAYIPTKGNIFVKNFKAGSPKANKFIGYIPERAIFPSFLKAKEYLKEMAKISKVPKKEISNRVLKMLEKFNLTEVQNKNPKVFSSGMQKKLLLAQALISDPDILILDEPAANLDPIARYDLFKELENLKLEGKTIFITSHVLTELEKIIDHVTFISKGKILYSGSLEELDKKVENIIVLKTTNNNVFLKILKEKSYDAFSNGLEINIRDFTDNEEILFILARENNLKIIDLKTRELQKAYKFLLDNEKLNKNLNSKKGK